MSELIKRSIEALSTIVNVSTGLAHPLDEARVDEARAKELFKALHAEGEPLTYETIKKFALDNHWPDRHADSLAELAHRIGAGGHVVINHPREWGEPTVARLKEEIKYR